MTLLPWRRTLAAFAFIVLLCAVPSQGAISVLDAAANSGSKTGGSSANTMAYTVSSGTNTVLLCGISAADTNSRTVSSFTWNGAALTQVPSARRNNAFVGWVDWWYKVSPAAAASQNVSVTLSGDVAFNFVFGCITYSGVDQSTIFDTTAQTAEGTSTSTSVSITTATNGAEVLGVAYFNFSVTATGNLTNMWNVTDGANQDVFAAQRTNKASAGSQAVTWSLDGSTDWLASAIALLPAGGGSPCPKTFMLLGVGCEQ